MTDPEIELAARIVEACEAKGSGPANGLRLAEALGAACEPLCALVLLHGADAEPMIHRALAYAVGRARDRKDALDRLESERAAKRSTIEE